MALPLLILHQIMKRLASLITLLLLGTSAAAQQPSPPQDQSPLALRGKRLFMIQGCYGCHTIGKLGTPIGPDLSRVGLKYEEAYLARWLHDPEAQRPNAHMPRLELDPAQIEALAAFLGSLR